MIVKFLKTGMFVEVSREYASELIRDGLAVHVVSSIGTVPHEEVVENEMVATKENTMMRRKYLEK